MTDSAHLDPIAASGLFSANSDAIYQLDLDGRFVAANEALCELTGYDLDELTGLSFRDVIHPDDLPRIDASVALGAQRFRHDVAIVEGWLRGAPRGTRLVTFHGFGGVVPEDFRLVASQRIGWDALRAWEKRGEGRR